MTSTGIRDLKDNLSRYLRRVERGERIVVTHRGRIVAELVPAGAAASGAPASRHEHGLAEGWIRPRTEAGDPLADLPSFGLPPGTAEALIAEDRGER